MRSWMRAIRSSRVRQRVVIGCLSSRRRVASVGILRRWVRWRYVSFFLPLVLYEDVHWDSVWNEKTGASLVYPPEQGMNLDLLRDDARFLKLRYGLDAKGKSEGRLVIRYVLPLRSPPALTPSSSFQQQRMRLDGLHDRRHHQDAQRRRRCPL